MMPAAEFIQAGGMKQFQKDKVLRFYLLAGQLESVVGEETAASSAFWHVANMPASRIVESGSSFFWYHSDRLYGATDAGEEVEEEAVALFLAHLFDSFFHELEDGQGVSLSGVRAESSVVLPSLKLRLPGSAQGGVLERVDARHIRHGDQTVDIHAPGELRLPAIEIPPKARLLFDADDLLVDTMASQRLADLAPDERRVFGEMIVESLAIIRSVDDELADRIEGLIRWYFPIKTPDKLRVHNSFTVSSLTGAMFLSEAYRLLALVEAIVHEYYHNELWVAMQVEPHLRDDGEEYLYSPWRRDARPVTGLYHGTYVFTGLLDFFEAALETPALAEHHDYLEQLRRKSYYQVRIALDQFPMQHMEPKGRNFLAKLAAIAESHGREIGADREGIPQPQLDHWHEWCEEYPELRGYATPPISVKYPCTPAA